MSGEDNSNVAIISVVATPQENSMSNYEIGTHSKGWFARRRIGGEMILMNGLDELIELRTALNRIVDQLAAKSFAAPLDDDVVITTGEALAIAESEGYEIPRSSLDTAIARGVVKAEKEGNRWQLNKASFAKWFEGWKAGK